MPLLMTGMETGWVEQLLIGWAAVLFKVFLRQAQQILLFIQLMCQVREHSDQLQILTVPFMIYPD